MTIRWIVAGAGVAVDTAIAATVALSSPGNMIAAGATALGILVAVGTLAGVVFGVRYRETARVNGENAAAWEHTAKRLGGELDAAKGALADALSDISRLEDRPDLTEILTELRSDHQHYVDLLEQHDRNATIRTDRVVDAIRTLGGPA